MTDGRYELAVTELAKINLDRTKAGLPPVDFARLATDVALKQYGMVRQNEDKHQGRRVA